MTIAEFDHLDITVKKELLQKCCGSSSWVNKMLPVFPVNDLIDLLEYADEKWNECTQEDWQEAFEHHPMIGDVQTLKEKFSSSADWASDEQSGVQQTSKEISEAISVGNRLYREKFGFIFIIYATGKSVQEMLSSLQKRLLNNPENEIKIAADEQIRITKKRLEKLFI
ncbi:MAG: 2-oxo-4-hydroxy-4-carboxy-5-ureidoimidazoline decarboxylase [Ginsengibacter sp.]